MMVFDELWVVYLFPNINNISNPLIIIQTIIQIIIIITIMLKPTKVVLEITTITIFFFA
jgi:hypothetical protein